MAADARGAWNETGEKLTDLGRKLKAHYEQQQGAEAQASRQELADAARRIGGAVQDAFEAIGAAAKDESVRSDVRQVGQSLVEALGATLGQASEEVKRALSERKGPAGMMPRAGRGSTTVEPAEPSAPADPAGPDGEQPPRVEPWGTP